MAKSGSDARIAELEKKVDGLSLALDAFTSKDDKRDARSERAIVLCAKICGGAGTPEVVDELTALRIDMDHDACVAELTASGKADQLAVCMKGYAARKKPKADAKAAKVAELEAALAAAKAAE